MNWRKYLDPETPQYKWAMREFARIKKGIETARYQKIINRNIRKVEG